MLLQTEIDIARSLDEAWELISDLERIASSVPGATLNEHEGDRYRGRLKVEAGPIGMVFEGSAEVITRDRAASLVVVVARGADAGGQSIATAEIRARLEPVGDGVTRVFVDTDLDVSGPIVQLGRGAMADLLSRLAAAVGDDLSRAHAPAATPYPVTVEPADTHDLNRLATLASTRTERYGYALLGAALGLLLSWLLFGRRPRP